MHAGLVVGEQTQSLYQTTSDKLHIKEGCTCPGLVVCERTEMLYTAASDQLHVKISPMHCWTHGVQEGEGNASEDVAGALHHDESIASRLVMFQKK